MKILVESEILVENANLLAVRLDETQFELKTRLAETIQKQQDVLKLKDVDQSSLRMVVQL
jgi:hypothetical protein